MTTVYDIPAEMLIPQAARDLKELPVIQPPEWAAVVKTGIHKEMPPEDPDWWYTRVASVLRRIYIDGPVGVERLRSAYGGNRDRGSNPSQFRKGSGSIPRKALQQLEAAGFVEKVKGGRQISAQGRAFMDGVAHGLRAAATEAAPELARY
ncbi:MAG: 30S ribosomal protein S19e [Methanofollis sp.]|jgi:small subunit ribosomal protein S19e|uniref:30S ribosomal protein S19e n=1 Tax=Methanofollis TaxID=81416 RepID=UPI000829FAC6|nr:MULTISPECIES: 30S ribosomal protein S19e [Methanofollis]MDD4254511.1 30S ribosomal protein S19e [Methanofollis sp.]